MLRAFHPAQIKNQLKHRTLTMNFRLLSLISLLAFASIAVAEPGI